MEKLPCWERKGYVRGNPFEKIPGKLLENPYSRLHYNVRMKEAGA